MEEPRRIDLTYITERIIVIFCPPECSEQTYVHNLREITHMLQSKHGHDYTLINLSQRNDTLIRMSHKVLDTGWTDLLAPNLDQIFSVCTVMENWLQAHPKHVLVLHCRGGKGGIGVLVASYIHFTNMSASADLSLDHFAMRRFFTDKLSSLMTPSQKRYVWMLGSMLKGGLRMCPSPSFLLCVVLHSLPKLRPDGGCCLFLRVYQSLQAVCTSAVYHVNAVQTDRLYFVLQPAQLLKGDIMVVCYDKNSGSSSRQVVFRLQFHTGLVQGHSLTFSKADLDCASEGIYNPLPHSALPNDQCVTNKSTSALPPPPEYIPQLTLGLLSAEPDSRSSFPRRWKSGTAVLRQSRKDCRQRAVAQRTLCDRRLRHFRPFGQKRFISGRDFCCDSAIFEWKFVCRTEEDQSRGRGSFDFASPQLQL